MALDGGLGRGLAHPASVSVQIFQESPQLRHVSDVGSSSMASLWQPGQRRRMMGRLSALRCLGVVPPQTPDCSLFVIAQWRHSALIVQRLHAACTTGSACVTWSSAKKSSGSIVRQLPSSQSGSSPMSFLTTTFKCLDESLEKIGCRRCTVHRRLCDVPLIHRDVCLPCGISACGLARQEVDLADHVAAMPKLRLSAELHSQVTSDHLANCGLTRCGAVLLVFRHLQVVPVQLRVRHPTQIQFR